MLARRIAPLAGAGGARCYALSFHDGANDAAPALTPRSDFYDFGLMARPHGGPAGDRLLTELSFVAFDPQTTGLSPAGGDAIGGSPPRTSLAGACWRAM
ncbi:MAG: hypothetical protein ACJA1L_001725 [Paracoccaceae bacterium]|jgi:hypothetical protein